MMPHTEKAHMTQRIRQVGNGSFPEIERKIEDRHALTSAYTYSRYYRRVSLEMAENICNDDLLIWKDFRNARLKPQLERAREVR